MSSLTETIKHSRRKATAAKKTASKSKQPQHPWLQVNGTSPKPESLLPPAVPERLGKAQPRGPPGLLNKAEVCAVAHCTYPTIWSWMRAGTFPRSKVVGGKSMWRSDEVLSWLDNLPRRRLKGDAE